MPKGKSGIVPPEKLELYDRLVATVPDIKRKGATVPYTALNGHMFSYLSKEGKLELRLPPAERELFLKKYNAKLTEAYEPYSPSTWKFPTHSSVQLVNSRSSSIAVTPTSVP